MNMIKKRLHQCAVCFSIIIVGFVGMGPTFNMNGAPQNDSSEIASSMGGSGGGRHSGGGHRGGGHRGGGGKHSRHGGGHRRSGHHGGSRHTSSHRFAPHGRYESYPQVYTPQIYPQMGPSYEPPTYAPAEPPVLLYPQMAETPPEEPPPNPQPPPEETPPSVPRKLPPKMSKSQVIQKVSTVKAVGRIPDKIRQAVLTSCVDRYFDADETDPFMDYMNFNLAVACVTEAIERYYKQHPIQPQNPPAQEEKKEPQYPYIPPPA